MSSSGANGRRGAIGLALLAVLSWVPAASLAQDADADAAQEADAGDPLTAAQALETARDTYGVPEQQRVTLCPRDTEEQREADGASDVIVVCRRLAPEYEFQTRDGPSGQFDRTADGVPRAPDFDESCLHTRGRANCIMVGNVPPPVLMVDVTKFPEPLSATDAAKVFRAPDEPAAAPPPPTGERVPIP